MTADRRSSKPDWSEVEKTLRELMHIDPEVLDQHLDTTCAGRPELKKRVQELLSVETGSESFVGQIVADGVAAFAHDTDPWVGAEVGRYRLKRRIGEGGMSTVYLAERADGTYDRTVCVKVIKRGMDTDAILRRFDYERQILAGLDHPNIARLYDGGSTEDGLPYFVMEHVEGLHIDEYCRQHDVDVGGRLDLFLQVCSAVHYAHQNLIVHRDLKPANIVVTSDGIPKLLDFGIATVLDSGEISRSTTIGAAFMTPAYASPEQILGERVTTASDVYSLSVLLYKILSGSAPFRGSSRSKLEHAVCHTTPIRPSERIVGDTGRRVAGDLDNIVLKGMDRDPIRRYSSAREIAWDIERHRSGMPVIARTPTFAYRMSKFVLRNKILVGAVLLLVSFASVMTWQSIRLDQSRDAKVIALERAEQTSRLLADVLDVTDPNVSFREARHDPRLEFGRGSFSLSVWIRVSRPTLGTVTILDKRVPPYLQSRGFSLFLYDDIPGLQLADGVEGDPRSANPKATGNNYVGEQGLADGRWHHVVAVADRNAEQPDEGRVLLFVDGSLAREFTGANVRAGDVSCDAPFRVGHESDGFHIARPFRGTIRDVRVFDIALESDQVAMAHRSGREQLGLDELYVEPSHGMPGDTVQVALVVIKRSVDDRSFTWTVAGVPEDLSATATIGRGIGPTVFRPTSGSLRLDAGPRKVEIPIGVVVPDADLGTSARFVVNVTDVRSGERMRATGNIRIGASSPTDPMVKPRAAALGAERHTKRSPRGIPLEFEVAIRPNELFADASIRFGIARDEAIDVEIEVANLQGLIVRRMNLGSLEPGQHSVSWDGRNDRGERLPNGLYAINILGRHRVNRWDPSRGRFGPETIDLLQRKVFQLR